MPVLSEQMTLVHPRVSTLESLLMMALRSAMRATPMASVTAVTAGRPSGMEATARATAVRRTVDSESPEINPMSATRATMPPAR